MDVVLNADELEALFRQMPETKKDGGWQGLIVGLQEKCNRETGNLQLSDSDLRRIPQYAFDYGNGGWESRLSAMFNRHLGPKLGR